MRQTSYMACKPTNSANVRLSNLLKDPIWRSLFITAPSTSPKKSPVWERNVVKAHRHVHQHLWGLGLWVPLEKVKRHVYSAGKTINSTHVQDTWENIWDTEISLNKTWTQYLRLFLCDQDEAIVVNEVTVNVLIGRWKKRLSEQNWERNLKSGLCERSYLVVTANATFSIQSCALDINRSLVSGLIRQFHCKHQLLFFSYLSACSPELPLKELKLHLDPYSWAQNPTRETESYAKKHQNRNSLGGRCGGRYLPRSETFCHRGAEWLCWPKPHSYFLKLDRRERHDVKAMCWDNILCSLDGALYSSGSAEETLQYRSLTPHEWSPVCSKMSLIILKSVSGLDHSDYDGKATVVRVIINGREVAKGEWS